LYPLIVYIAPILMYLRMSGLGTEQRLNIYNEKTNALHPHKSPYTCNTLQHTASHCSTLRHTATHCDTLRHIATHCSTLQHTASHCNTLQHTATSQARRREIVLIRTNYLHPHQKLRSSASEQEAERPIICIHTNYSHSYSHQCLNTSECQS